MTKIDGRSRARIERGNAGADRATRELRELDPELYVKYLAEWDRFAIYDDRGEICDCPNLGMVHTFTQGVRWCRS